MLTGSNFARYETLSDVLQDILAKLNAFTLQTPEDKVYIHSDKPFYKPGETIWFAVYVRNGKDLKPSEQSDIVNVEIINPKGSLEKAYKIIAKDGVAQGDFAIDAAAMGGLYKIRAFTDWQKNDPEPAIFEKEVQVQAVVLPRLKMKLDFQKDAYGPGAPVTCDLTLNTNENKPLANYAFSYTVNIDGNKILQEKATTNESGAALIAFSLPKELATNDGLLNVMIDYQGQTEAISRSVPIILNNIQVAFYPEGGDMVANMPAKVAFRALNEFGKTADVTGYISDSKGNSVADFESFHKGMGAFTFTPKEDETYTAHITQPENIDETFALPDALPKGYVLEVESAEKGNVFLNIHSTENENLSIIATVHGQKYFASTIKVHTGKNDISIPTDNMPMGIAQITVFDSKGIARAERLAFVNQHKKLNVELTTDKEKYLPREKVNLTVKVKDERGMPMPANLSLSVVNDQLLSFADDKSANILSWLLVEGELKGKVEEPNFYFDEKEPAEKREMALNYLLMTAGWRRYTWKEVLADQPRIVTYQAEKAVIAGTVWNSQENKPFKGAKVFCENPKIEAITDENGKFYFRGVTIESPFNLRVQADKMYEQNIYVSAYSTNYQAYMYLNIPRPMPTAMATAPNMGGMKAGGAAPSRAGGVVKDGRADMDLPKKSAKPGKGGQVVGEAPVMIAEMAPPPVPVAEALIDEQDEVVENNAAMDREEMNQPMEVLAEPVAMAVEMEDERIHAAFDDMGAEEPELADVDNGAWWGNDVKKPAIPVATKKYYLAKQFASPDYGAIAAPEPTMVRNDFRSTLYWNGNVITDRTGKTTLSFFTSDEITSFRITAEGIATDGMVGRAEKVMFSQLPFSLSAKIPVEVITEDVIKIPVTLVNNTEKSLSAPLEVTVPEGMTAVSAGNPTVTLAAKEAKTVYLAYNVVSTQGKGTFSAKFKAWGLSDAIEQAIKIVPKGFPVKLAGSGADAEKEYTFDLKNVVKGSQTVTFTAFPSTVSEILKGLEGMLQEPYGCFEQTSSSTYPNILVLNYLNSTGQANPEVVKRAKDLIGKGYARLAGYESKSGGFEWFGGDPAHEGLTAYGLMEFMDMQKVWDGVDSKMVNRTAEWLLKRRDGKGGFERNPRALHEFGLTDQATMSTYIVWALSEFQQKGIEKEVNKSYEVAMETKNPYQLGLVANIMFNYGKQTEGKKALNELIKIQNQNGVWTAKDNDRSAPGSGGQGLAIETASLGLSAMMKQDNADMANIRKVAEFIRNCRNSGGSFGNTNSTVLALRALIQYAIFSKKTDEDGKIEIYADGKKVGEKSYKKGEQNPIVIDNLAQYAGEGKHTFKVKYVGVKNPLPYTISVNYYTALPNSNPECVVKLDTKLAATQAKVGETLRLTATLTNTKNEGQAMTMAIIGLPAGLSAQPWQLKEMKEKAQCDFYEVSGNNVILYYRQMKPSEIRTINFDLKADIAGNYEAPASCAYLYYTNEYKYWTSMNKVAIGQ